MHLLYFSGAVHPLQRITVDDQLNWKQLVTNSVRAAYYRIHMLRRLRSLGTPANDLRGEYTFLILLPELMYVCFLSVVLLSKSDAKAAARTVAELRWDTGGHVPACFMAVGHGWPPPIYGPCPL